MNKLTCTALAALCAASTLAAPAAQAGPWGRDEYGHDRGFRHHGLRRGSNVAGALAAGAAIGLIGGAIVASQAQREREAAARYYDRPRSYYGD